MNYSTSKTKSRSFPRDAVEQAEIVHNGWNRVGDRLLVPNLDQNKFVGKLKEAKEHVDKAEQLKIERAKAIQERNVVLGELWDLVKRVRNAAKATFGDYSPELEMLVNETTDQNDARS